jgi:predicted RNA binding protein YcfA (HicA-like mRNA interferase family)
MSRKDILLQSLKNNPKDISFEDIKRILENSGYKAFNTGGSHWVFRKDGKCSITIPYKRPIKAIYVKKVIKELDL